MYHQTQRQFIINIVIVLAVAVIAFYGGNVYGKSSAQSVNGMGGAGGRAGMVAGGNANRTRAFGAGMGTAGGMGAGVLSGEVISKDDMSVTIKLRDGGSRIGFVGSSTSVAKSVAGAFGDVQIGDQVMLIGKGNPDGSVNAQTIQIRPKM